MASVRTDNGQRGANGPNAAAPVVTPIASDEGLHQLIAGVTSNAHWAGFLGTLDDIGCLWLPENSRPVTTLWALGGSMWFNP